MARDIPVFARFMACLQWSNNPNKESPMVGNRYRLLKPASAVYPGEKPSCVHLPQGSIIRVIEAHVDGARLVGVVHEDRRLLMFVEDICNGEMAARDAIEG
jgi:hypothetical protein